MAPVELFTGLQTTTPLDTLMLPPNASSKARLMKIYVTNVDEELELLRESLQEMHQEVSGPQEEDSLVPECHEEEELQCWRLRTAVSR